MQKLNPFRHRAFCWISLAVNLLAFALPHADAGKLGVFWLFYVWLYAAVDMWRRGLKGMIWPTVVLAVVGVSHPHDIGPVAYFGWCMCAFVHLGRLAWKAIGGAARFAHRQMRGEDTVRVVAVSAAPAPDASVILAKFGFHGEYAT